MADTNLLVLAREYKKLREEVKKALSMPKGDKGDRGEKGEKGDTGSTGPQGFPGRDGKDGINGFNGKDGRDGVDGKDGKDGLDGVGVKNAYIDFDNSLVIVLSDGSEINAGFLSQETKDAVMATFKQGASTINELLPSQEGNANKFLKTDGTNVSWDTLDGSDIDLASPPVIGNTTPNSATFTTLSTGALTATGQTSLGGAAGSEGLRVTPVASAVNYWEALGSTAANGTVTLQSNGSNSVISNRYLSKGTGVHVFDTGGGRQLYVANTASAVNYVQVTGAATTSPPVISVQGADANSTLAIASKGTGAIRFDTGGATAQFRVLNTASAVNRIDVTGSATGFAVPVSISGSDTNIALAFISKGTGAIDLAAGSSGVNISNGGTVTAITRTATGSGYTSPPTWTASAPTTAGGTQASGTTVLGNTSGTTTVVSGGAGYTVGDVLTFSGGVFTTASTVTVSAVSGGVITAVTVSSAGSYSTIPSNPISVTGGTGTGATFSTTWGITATLTITNAGSGYIEQPSVTFSGGGGSGAAATATVGSGTVIRTLGGTLDFYTPNQQVGFRVSDYSGSSGVGYWTVFGGNATPRLRAIGASSGAIETGSAVPIQFLTNGTAASVEQLRVAHTASAVNYVQVTGGSTGNFPVISAQGSDAATGLNFSSKSSARINFFNQGGITSRQVSIGGNGTTAVNYLDLNGSATGVAPSIGVAGTDTNIDLALAPKGTGVVQFGTYTASILTPTGYITIKDSGGTTRRVLIG